MSDKPITPITVDASLAYVRERFDELHQRFDHMDQRFDEVLVALQSVTAILMGHEARIRKLEENQGLDQPGPWHT